MQALYEMVVFLMGAWTQAVLKQIARPKEVFDPPRGKAICTALKQHHWGVLERWGFGKDGAAGWQPYKGCKRCGQAA